jgi:DNA-binding beta-propeller fold protein YncE
MPKARVTGLVVFSAALMLALGCRAVTDSGADAGAGDASPPVADAQVGPDSRFDPPIVRPVTDITVETLAGSDVKGSAEGTGATAQFDNPVGVLLDAAGTALYVTEYEGRRLRMVPFNGPTTTLASGLPEPFALLATEDAIYVQTDRDRNGIKGANTGTIWKIPLAGGQPDVFIEGLGRPRGLARLPDGRAVVSDRDRHTVSILNLADRTLTKLAGSGNAGFFDARGEGAQFHDPSGVAVLPDGSVLVADSQNHVIRRVTLEGDVTVFAGDKNPGMKDDADKLKARFDTPIDLAVDVAGNVFVSDLGNRRIRRISSEGVVETLAGSGVRGFEDGHGATAKFYGQEQIEVAPDGKTVYVSDGNEGDGNAFHRVRRILLP